MESAPPEGGEFLAIWLIYLALSGIYLLLGSAIFILESNINLEKKPVDKPILYDYIFRIVIVLELLPFVGSIMLILWAMLHGA